MATRAQVPRFVPLFNPIARRLLRAGALLGPNALLSVRGRRTGQLRTTPVALVEAGGKRYTVGTFGDVNWVRNLRAAGEATVTVGRRAEHVRAVELDHEKAASFFANVLAPTVGRTRLARWLLDTVLHASDILDDPRAAAERRPVFELTPADA